MYKYIIARNNLDLLRLLLASSVLIIHAAYINPQPILQELSNLIFSFSSRAVSTFFVLSGFLVYMSLEKSSSTLVYIRKRVLRIYPAYIVLIIVSCVAGIFLTNLSIKNYFNFQLFKYLASNLFFLNFLTPQLPGVTFESPTNVVNGALWTLKIEVMFYFFVYFIYFLNRKFSHHLVLTSLYLISTICSLAASNPELFMLPSWFSKFQYQFPMQLRYFIAGIFLYLFYEKIKDNILVLLFCSTLVFYFNIDLLEPLAIAVFISFFALIPKLDVGLSKYGDLSYGVYIYHFPVFQILTKIHEIQSNSLLFFIAGTLIAFFLAFISWNIIEKRAIKLKID